MRKRRCLLFMPVCLLLLSGCPAKVSTYQRFIGVGDTLRTYYVHPPSIYDGSYPVPLLIALHPLMTGPLDMERITQFSGIADRENFIVVYPEGINRCWNDGSIDFYDQDDVRFIDTLIDAVGAEFNIDPARVYIVGASNGAFMTYRLACEIGGRFAAAAVVMGAPMPEALYCNCRPAKAMPFLMMHGTSDPVVPFSGGVMPVMPEFELTFKTFFDSMWFWVDCNALDPSKYLIEELDENAGDGTSVTKIFFRDGNATAPVLAYVINHGGHTWPGYGLNLREILVGRVCYEIDASETIWNFFANFPAGDSRQVPD